MKKVFAQKGFESAIKKIQKFILEFFSQILCVTFFLFLLGG